MDDAEHQAAPATSAPARTCGACTICCKLIAVAELDKPQDVRCSHCTPGKGCGIHDTRPTVCRKFYCGWLLNTALGDDWRPDRAKFVLMRKRDTGRLFIACDPAAPDAWRREPYYSTIKSFLTQAGTERQAERKVERQVIIILTGRHATLIAPQGEFDLGDWNGGDTLTMKYDREDRLVEATLAKAAPESPGPAVGL